MVLCTTVPDTSVLSVRIRSIGIRGRIICKGELNSMVLGARMELMNDRHVRVHHVEKDKDDAALREVLAQRIEGAGKQRRRRTNAHGSISS